MANKLQLLTLGARGIRLEFSWKVCNNFQLAVLGLLADPSSSDDEASLLMTWPLSDAKPRPHVLFLIDHLMALGGGETNLLKVVQLMPPELVRCSIATFRIKPEIRQSISVPVYVFPWKRFFHLDAWKAAIALRKLIRDRKSRHRSDIF